MPPWTVRSWSRRSVIWRRTATRGCPFPPSRLPRPPRVRRSIDAGVTRPTWRRQRSRRCPRPSLSTRRKIPSQTSFGSSWHSRRVCLALGGRRLSVSCCKMVPTRSPGRPFAPASSTPAARGSARSWSAPPAPGCSTAMLISSWQRAFSPGPCTRSLWRASGSTGVGHAERRGLPGDRSAAVQSPRLVSFSRPDYDTIVCRN